MGNIFSELLTEGDKQKQAVKQTKATDTTTRQPASKVAQVSAHLREDSRKPRRSVLMMLKRLTLNKDELEEFSFSLRKEHMVQVQATLPEGWKKELEDMAYRLGIGKLELYRFIYGVFLGKIDPDDTT